MNDLELLRVRSMLGREAHIFDLVHVAEVGSTIYGTGVGQDDLDVTAVWMEGWRELVNGPNARQSMMIRTKPGSQPSEPGDLDINVYTLRKFALLAAKGNPSILTALYSPNAATSIDLEPLKRFVASQRAGDAYLGYLRSQRNKLRNRTYPSRANLIEKFGYDTKSAYHAIRLGFQGFEYVSYGTLSIPFGEHRAKFLIQVREGAFSIEDVELLIDDVIEDLKDALATSDLPKRPDWTGLEHWLTAQYREHLDGLG